MSLGENIYNLRKTKKISQEQLGEKVNVTRQTISNWELNETTPNPNQLKLLSKVLDVSIDELLDNEIIQTRSNDKVTNKYSIQLYLSIICSVIWFFAAIIAFVEENEIVGIVYCSLSIIWIINAIFFYYRMKKNN